MDWNRINALLEKYWEGETSVEEEKELKQFFCTIPPHQLPAHLTETAALFRYYAREEASSPLGESFDEQLISRLKARPFARSEESRSLVWSVVRFAACLCLVLGTVWILRSKHTTTEAPLVRQTEVKPPAPKAKDTYDDPQRAYAEARKALLMVSAQLNKGRTYAGEVRKINKAEQLIQRGGTSDSSIQ